MVTPTIKLFSLLLHRCNFATVMSHNVSKYLMFPMVLGDPCERVLTPKGVLNDRLRTAALRRKGLRENVNEEVNG